MWVCTLSGFDSDWSFVDGVYFEFMFSNTQIKAGCILISSLINVNNKSFQNDMIFIDN